MRAYSLVSLVLLTSLAACGDDIDLDTDGDGLADLEEEALGTDPDLVSTACPLCTTMLSDGVAQRVLEGTLDPSPVFDMTVDLDGIPDGYAAMHERKALKVLVKP